MSNQVTNTIIDRINTVIRARHELSFESLCSLLEGKDIRSNHIAQILIGQIEDERNEQFNNWCCDEILRTDDPILFCNKIVNDLFPGPGMAGVLHMLLTRISPDHPLARIGNPATGWIVKPVLGATRTSAGVALWDWEDWSTLNISNAIAISIVSPVTHYSNVNSIIQNGPKIEIILADSTMIVDPSKSKVPGMLIMSSSN